MNEEEENKEQCRVSEKNHKKIVVLVGLSGSGKSTVADYSAEHGIPRVRFETLPETIFEINSLNASGQHTVVVDGIGGFTDFISLKRHYPGSVVTIALLANRDTRVRRLASRAVKPLTEHEVNSVDSATIERDNIGGIIALADYFIISEREMEEIVVDVERLFKNLELIN